MKSNKVVAHFCGRVEVCESIQPHPNIHGELHRRRSSVSGCLQKLTWIQQNCDVLSCKFLLTESVHARLKMSSWWSTSGITLLEEMSALYANLQPSMDARWQAEEKVVKKLGVNRRCRHQIKRDVKFLEQWWYCWKNTTGGMRLQSLHSFCLLIQYRITHINPLLCVGSLPRFPTTSLQICHAGVSSFVYVA